MMKLLKPTSHPVETVPQRKLFLPHTGRGGGRHLRLPITVVARQKMMDILRCQEYDSSDRHFQNHIPIPLTITACSAPHTSSLP